MQRTRRWPRRGVAAAALAASLLAGGAVAEDAAPSAERVALDETSGRVEEALAGWAARYLAVPAAADRSAAMQRYLALAAKKPSEADPGLLDAIQRSGPGIRTVAGRRAVLVAPEDLVPAAEVARLAALLDGCALAAERLTGVRPPVGVQTKDDTRPRDGAGRLLVGVWPLPKPVADAAFDLWADVPDDAPRGAGLAFSVAGAFVRRASDAALNARTSAFEPALRAVLRDAAVRELGEPLSVAAADAYRKKAKEELDLDWSPGCLPGDWMPPEGALAQLFFAALDAERAAGREPVAAIRAFLSEPRRASGWSAGRVASQRDVAMEPLAAVLAPKAADVFRAAGLLPSGDAYEEMKLRVTTEDVCAEARALNQDPTRGAAARAYRGAADALGASLAADDLVVEALEIEEREDSRKARAAAQKLPLLGGFDFLGPFPEGAARGEASPAVRLVPLAVATAPSRHAFKSKEPAELSLKWAEVKDPYGKIVERTPWGDKRGITWGGAAVASTRLAKDLGRLIRIRPLRLDAYACSVLADGRWAEPWADGSFVVPGAKGTEIVLACGSRIPCALPWRDAKTVDQELAAAVAAADPLRALRPWAERRIAAALPAIVAKLTALPDDALAREVRILAPYCGGDAAAADALLARADGHPAALSAYLDVCRGTRDAAVLARLVALATAPGAAEDTVARVRYVLDGAFFRKVSETGPALAALAERGRKWMAETGFAEAEDLRDLVAASPSFRVLGSADGWGKACIGPTAATRGEGYLALDLPDGTAASYLSVRWKATPGGRLTLRGAVTDGKKTKPFVVDLPAPVRAGNEWTLDAVEIGVVPRGRVALVIDDPCASGCRIDAFAIGPKPLD